MEKMLSASSWISQVGLFLPGLCDSGYTHEEGAIRMLDLGSARTEKIPLAQDADGTVRVGGTRVTLDVLMESYDQGATAEELAQKFGDLRIDDVYAVLTYYPRHPEEVRAYLAERESQAEDLEREI